jgi:hypothetical protein
MEGAATWEAERITKPECDNKRGQCDNAARQIGSPFVDLMV